MLWLPNWIARRPSVPELDFAGVVVDKNDTEFHKGDAVFGWVELCT
jgi:NADPH:quinone reductase-like Zn-dependent oxidoreductase